MLKLFLASSLLILSTYALSADEPNYADFDAFQGTLTHSTAAERLKKTLIKSPSLESQIDLQEKQLLIFASSDDKAGNRPEEFKLLLGDKPRPVHPKDNKGTAEKPLRGKRIALDPGHFGGRLARVEGRFVDMVPSAHTRHRADLQFDEGTLSVTTALYLKMRLEQAGATVLMTRTQPGEAVYEKSYEDWRNEVGKDVKLGVYLNLDYQARAEKINRFAPDLTYFIHFNADGVLERDRTTQKNPGTPENYNMAFVPGSFEDKELSLKRSRYEFIRLLVTDDWDQSVRVSNILMKKMVARTGVPLCAADNKTAPYLQKNCLATSEPGVFARNLAVNRLVHGVTAYGEVFCQDNFGECQRLADKSAMVSGIKTSSRIFDVADAYYDATLEIFGR